MRTRAIADKLYVAEETIKTHRKKIILKLNATGITHAVAIAIRKGLI